jgi:uncharacterized protein
VKPAGSNQIVIWDLHCHLANVSGRTAHERMASLLQIADRLDIERVVIFMGFPWSVDPSPDDLRRENDQVLAALEHWHDRAFGFVYLNPKHTDASLGELDRCVADGPMIGVKLWVAQTCESELLDPLVERATELNALIYQHTWLKREGNLVGESTPMQLAKLAGRHPQAQFICGHSGGDWERGFRAIRTSPNVSAGLGGFDPTAGVTEMAVRILGPERVVFGSDAGGRSFASQLGKIRGADVSPDVQRMILKENLRRLLTPALIAKGRTP